MSNGWRRSATNNTDADGQANELEKKEMSMRNRNER